MCDAENLALHRTLAVGDHRAEPVAVFLNDDSRIQTLRRFHGRNRRTGIIGREQLQAQRSYRGAGCARQHFGIGHQLIHAEGLDVFQSFRESQQQRRGGRPTGFAIRGVLFLFLQIEVIPRQLGGLCESPGLGTDG